MPCRDQRALGYPCRQRPQPCCPGRRWNAEVCGCVNVQAEPCKVKRWICTASPRRIAGELATNQCLQVVKPACPIRMRLACVCDNNQQIGFRGAAAGGGQSAQAPSGLPTESQLQQQALYGILPGTSPLHAPPAAGRAIPTASRAITRPAAVAGLAPVRTIGQLIYPGLFGQLDRRNRETITDMALPFGTARGR